MHLFHTIVYLHAKPYHSCNCLQKLNCLTLHFQPSPHTHTKQLAPQSSPLFPLSFPQTKPLGALLSADSTQLPKSLLPRSIHLHPNSQTLPPDPVFHYLEQSSSSFASASASASSWIFVFVAVTLLLSHTYANTVNQFCTSSLLSARRT